MWHKLTYPSFSSFCHHLHRHRRRQVQHQGHHDASCLQLWSRWILEFLHLILHVSFYFATVILELVINFRIILLEHFLDILSQLHEIIFKIHFLGTVLDFLFVKFRVFLDLWLQLFDKLKMIVFQLFYFIGYSYEFLTLIDFQPFYFCMQQTQLIWNIKFFRWRWIITILPIYSVYLLIIRNLSNPTIKALYLLFNQRCRLTVGFQNLHFQIPHFLPDIVHFLVKYWFILLLLSLFTDMVDFVVQILILLLQNGHFLL